jgi:predicted nicotinamide N-methyase
MRMKTEIFIDYSYCVCSGAHAKPKSSIWEIAMHELIQSVTQSRRPVLLPEIELQLVTPASPWWTLTPEAMQAMGIPDPYWAFVWPGGQALARHLLDHPEIVRGRPVIDFGAGSGVLAKAACLAGAASVLALDIDPWSIAACQINLADYDVSYSAEDWIGRPLPQGTVLLCGDMSYDRELTGRILDWFSSLKGCSIWIGDPSRGYLSADQYEVISQYKTPSDCDPDGRYWTWTSVGRWRP